MVKPGDFVKIKQDDTQVSDTYVSIVEKKLEGSKKPSNDLHKLVSNGGTVLETRVFAKVIVGTVVEWIEDKYLEIKN